MNYKNILIEKKNHTAIVTINRVEKLNALNNELLNELKFFFTSVKEDESVFVIVLTGSGEKAFVAGADITEFKNLDVSSGKKFSERGQEVFNIIENCGKLVIAAVNGYALGGGCELALACHIRYASENAKFGFPEVNLGIIPGFGGTYRLTKLINTGFAAEMILTAKIIDANEALKLGMINKITSSSELLNDAFILADTISSKGQIAVRSALKAILNSQKLSFNDSLNLEAELFGICCGTEDFKEGNTAFLDKRKPVFKNK